MNLTRCNPLTNTHARLALLVSVLLIAAVTGWADGYTTLYAVGHLGADEANPVIAALMGTLGVWGATFWTALGWTAWMGALVLVGMGTRLQAVRNAVVPAVILVLAGKALVVVNNLQVISTFPN